MGTTNMKTLPLFKIYKRCNHGDLEHRNWEIINVKFSILLCTCEQSLQYTLQVLMRLKQLSIYVIYNIGSLENKALCQICTLIKNKILEK